MPLAHKRRAIEKRLGEDLEGFIMGRIASGQAIRSIAREVGFDPATVRYYRGKYGMPSKLYWKGKSRSGPAIYRKEETRALNARFRGRHVDICLCRLCGDECREREGTHEEGRCVVVCSDFRGRLRNG